VGYEEIKVLCTHFPGLYSQHFILFIILLTEPISLNVTLENAGKVELKYGDNILKQFVSLFFWIGSGKKG
jgi:hypothetical protein